MISRMKKGLAVLALGLLAMAGSADAADAKHRLVLHVDEADPATMNLVLNNAANVAKHYMDKGEEVQIDIVAYGPGLTMLRSDTSPVADRVKSFGANFPDVSFKACGNTITGVAKKEGKEPPIFAEAEVVTSGVVHLMERQEQGWAYVRP